MREILLRGKASSGFRCGGITEPLFPLGILHRLDLPGIVFEVRKLVSAHRPKTGSCWKMGGGSNQACPPLPRIFRHTG